MTNRAIFNVSRPAVMGALLFSVSATALLTAPAAAQEQAAAAAAPAESFDEIVVTAQRRAQRLSEVPLSITAIGGEALESRNFNDVSDLGKLVAGLSVSESGFATPIYTLRGVGVNEQSLGSSSSVAVYLDEVPLAYPVITQGATFDLQRVEVLKGPQGTLYGQNATGGAINYIANKPTEEFAAGASATFGRFNRGSVEGYVSGPLGSTLKARIAGRASFGDGWQRSLTRNDSQGAIKNYTGRAIVQWDPAETVRFSLNVNGWIDKSDTLVSQLISFPASALPKILNSPVPGRNARDTDWDADQPFDRDDKFWQASLRAEVDLTDQVTLTSITAYSDLDRHQTSELDGIAAWRVLRNEQSGSIKAFSQEARITANFSGITWILGANISDDATKDYVDQDLRDSSQVTPLNATGAGLFNNQKINNWSVFTNIDIKLTDQLTLGGGVRLSEETRSFEGCSTIRDAQSAPGFTGLLNGQRARAGLGPIPTLAVGDCTSIYATAASLESELNPNVVLFQPTLVTQKFTENNVPWNINLNWKPVPNAMIYGRVSRGFKAGNFSTLGSTDAQGFKPITQEELVAYEIGGRLSIGRTLSLEGALFHYDYTNKQLRARIFVGPPFNNINAQQNIPKSRLKGGEFTIVARPITGLSLAVSGTYVDSKIQRYTGYTVDSQLVNFAGAEFNFTPKWALNGDLNYKTPISDGLEGFVGVNAAYRGNTISVFANPGNTTLSLFDIKKYTLVDGQLGVSDSDGKWKAFIWGKNIFNKYYWTNVVRVSTVNVRYPGTPATFGGTVSYQF
jgi:iron complex outermembrane receptor protein